LTRVYVTSSDDPDILPGVHRLLDLKAFPKVDCSELKDQRCGVDRKLVAHGRKKPTCGFFCSIGKGLEGVGAGLLTVGTAAMSVFPSPIGSTLGDMGSDVVSYLYPMPPPGSSTDVVHPYSSIGRAALYGVSPAIFGSVAAANTGYDLNVGSAEWAKDHAGNLVKKSITKSIFGPVAGFGLNLPGRRALRTDNYLSRQVDWTYDAVFSATYVNPDSSYQEPTEEYTTGRDFLLNARCFAPSVDVRDIPGARVCGGGSTAWFRGTRGCYQNELSLESKPGAYSRVHFLSRLGIPPPPPRPPPQAPPPSPPPPCALDSNRGGKGHG